MNKHLNIFRTYTKEDRAYQLENDLTRSLAICFQEDSFFFYEVLKIIFDQTDSLALFDHLDQDVKTLIEIQKRSSDINEFDRVFAVSLSEHEMSDFWSQNNNSNFDPICDMVITIDNILIVIEAKRDNVDCTEQLYNQVFNIFKNKKMAIEDNKNRIFPVDLNWKKLMTIAVKVASFEKTMGNSNRFLSDFIDLVRNHNFEWLPEPCLNSLVLSNTSAIYRRIETAITEFCKEKDEVEELPYRDRLGCRFTKDWANELLFSIDKKKDSLNVAIYPGNTKGQGYSLFNKNTTFKSSLEIDGECYELTTTHHIKFTGQSYITGLWLCADDFQKTLYTKENFDKTGRKKRGGNDWDDVVKLLDTYIKQEFKWKDKCCWKEKLIDSDRTLFNLSFGYEISMSIPFDRLKQIDKEQNNINPLVAFVEKIYGAFENDLLEE
jgi:hypothetical protein